MKKTKHKIRRIIRVLCIFTCCTLFYQGRVHADLADPASLSDAVFGYFSEFEVSGEVGWLQSICSTDHYIICVENNTLSGKTSEPDSLVAFYKNDSDKDGNPVEKYGYAKTVTQMDFEHANGATFNPDTNEIAIAPGPLVNKSSRGDIYILDADTLLWKRTVKVDQGKRNYIGIGYSEITKQYVLQGSGKTGYQFYIADQEFNITDTIEDVDYHDTLQDFCVSGDYILSVSCNPEMNFIHTFSISQRKRLATYPIRLEGEYERTPEMESICELSPGLFLVGSAMNDPRRIRLDIAQVPSVLRVTTAVENGTITEGNNQIEKYSDYTVNFETKRHYELTSLLVNGKEVEFEPGQASYTFQEIQDDYDLKAVFSKIPKYEITTSVQHGRISESTKKYRNKGCQVTYQPDEHYELDRILIDGQEVDTKGIEAAYEFKDIQSAHNIEVIFKEIPSWSITTSVTNGRITEAIEKAYRGTTETVTYQPIENAVLLYVRIDGTFVKRRDYGSSYTFADIQGAHTVEVLYVWKYLPLCAAGGGVAGLLLLIKAMLWHKRRKIRLRQKRKRFPEEG